MLNMTTYKCGICDTKLDQISHHKSHLKTEKHKDKKELFQLIDSGSKSGGETNEKCEINNYVFKLIIS